VVAHTAETRVEERAANGAAAGTPAPGGAVSYVSNGVKVYVDGAAAAALNGNGNGSAKNGNGATAAAEAAAAAATAAAVAVTAGAAAAAAGAAPRNANGAAAAAASTRVLNTIDEDQNAVAAGKLELAAVTGAPPRSAAGTPYSNPGGRWSKFKTYGGARGARLGGAAPNTGAAHAEEGRQQARNTAGVRQRRAVPSRLPRGQPSRPSPPTAAQCGSAPLRSGASPSPLPSSTSC
jgi:hypothetical protein